MIYPRIALSLLVVAGSAALQNPAAAAPLVYINKGVANQECDITPTPGTVFTINSQGDVLITGSYTSGACGSTGSSSSPTTPTFTPFNPAPADLTIANNSLGSNGGTVTPNFVVYYANTCTGSAAPSSGCTAVSGAWGAGTAVCTGTTPTGGQLYCSPSGTVTMPANTTGTACTYTFRAHCTNSTSNAFADSQTATVTVSGTGNTGGCNNGDTSGDQPGFTRQCSGPLSDDAQPARSGSWSDFASVYGTWPGSSTNGGKTQKLTINKMQYAALQFTPTATSPGVDGWASNETYMPQGGVMSVSTAPGYFNSTSPQTVCSKSTAGFTISNTSTGFCKLQNGVTYYLNFAAVDTSGNALCGSSSCLAAWTFQRVQ